MEGNFNVQYLLRSGKSDYTRRWPLDVKLSTQRRCPPLPVSFLPSTSHTQTSCLSAPKKEGLTIK
uniref:Uncharacterized protein n=1 Tax=Echinococcus canadensis TaxID=519352 RepID=A0A915EY92_9CEST